jgi:hypothetical protein
MLPPPLSGFSLDDIEAKANQGKGSFFISAHATIFGASLGRGAFCEQNTSPRSEKRRRAFPF